MANKIFRIGNKIVDFDEDKFILGNVSYPYEKGLLELIFKKNPAPYSVKDENIKTYGKILKFTNAHRKHFLPEESIKSNTSPKYTDYVLKALEVTGDGIPLLPKYMVANNSQVQYTHWDDPNELVDRLRILVAERQAGNNSHDNEILSIIEELREAEIIY